MNILDYELKHGDLSKDLNVFKDLPSEVLDLIRALPPALRANLMLTGNSPIYNTRNLLDGRRVYSILYDRSLKSVPRELREKEKLNQENLTLKFNIKLMPRNIYTIIFKHYSCRLFDNKVDIIICGESPMLKAKLLLARAPTLFMTGCTLALVFMAALASKISSILDALEEKAADKAEKLMDMC